jgi:aldehyde:ferredoxin oxidoreductase
MNGANGFAAGADDLPGRFFSEPGTAGGAAAVPPLDREAFLAARARYYTIRGLDPAGRPLPEKAADLGLPWID